MQDCTQNFLEMRYVHCITAPLTFIVLVLMQVFWFTPNDHGFLLWEFGLKKKKKFIKQDLLSIFLCSYRSLCVQDPVPLTFKSCVIAKDCETSEWSSWSACSRTCGWGDLAPGFRSRRRGVRSVAVGAGKQCPELEEREACSVGGKELLQPCPRYSECF